MMDLTTAWRAAQILAITWAFILWRKERKERKRICLRCKHLLNFYKGDMVTCDRYFCTYYYEGERCFQKAPDICHRFEDKEDK